jgi:hypothetical protein
MSHELQRFVTTLLSPTAEVHLDKVTVEQETAWLQLTVRKFVCQNPSCERHIFTERLPTFVAAYARKTQRLVTALRTIGMALGGQAGARLAARLRLPTSPATLLRLVQAAPMPQTPALQVVGVRLEGSPSAVRCNRW